MSVIPMTGLWMAAMLTIVGELVHMHAQAVLCSLLHQFRSKTVGNSANAICWKVLWSFNELQRGLCLTHMTLFNTANGNVVVSVPT